MFVLMQQWLCLRLMAVIETDPTALATVPTQEAHKDPMGLPRECLIHETEDKTDRRSFVASLMAESSPLLHLFCLLSAVCLMHE
jgi:hypothetical protein